MHREGHIGTALLLYSPLAFIAGVFGGQQPVMLGGVLAVGLAMAPDIDMRTPLVKHRGPTHTLWFAAFVAILGSILGLLIGLQHGLLAGLSFMLFGGLVAGVSVVSHLIADALTPMGVTPLIPINSRKITWNVARASNPIANYALLGLGGGIALLAAVGGLWLNSFLGL